MPSLEHNGLIDLFRENPSLAPHLLDALFHVQLPPHASVGVVDSALDELVPVELRADLVLRLEDEAGKVVFSIVLEVQRSTDPDKEFSWPAYLAVERSRTRGAAIVLVIATDASVARWAGTEIDLGLGLSRVRPLVLGPSVVPVITDQDVADREVELAILSALAHGNGPEGLAVLGVALRALERLDPKHGAVYFQIIYTALREPLQRAMERLVMERQAEHESELPPFLQQYRLEGRLEGSRAALLRLMQRAGIPLTEAERARVETCTDAATLERWLDNVLGAKTAADVLR